MKARVYIVCSEFPTEREARANAEGTNELLNRTDFIYRMKAPCRWRVMFPAATLHHNH